MNEYRCPKCGNPLVIRVRKPIWFEIGITEYGKENDQDCEPIEGFYSVDENEATEQKLTCCSCEFEGPELGYTLKYDESAHLYMVERIPTLIERCDQAIKEKVKATKETEPNFVWFAFHELARLWEIAKTLWVIGEECRIEEEYLNRSTEGFLVSEGYLKRHLSPTYPWVNPHVFYLSLTQKGRELLGIQEIKDCES